MEKKPLHFPGLNGIRALAALAVLFSHITVGLADYGLDPFLFGKHENGEPQGSALAEYGVSIFFVLSGFLITYLLQAEKDKGSINIKKFYVRRILRIWPLYYSYLFVCVVFMIMSNSGFDIKGFLLYFFMAANVAFLTDHTLPFLFHYWSLGVEEQFYLIWPSLNKKIKNIIPLIIVTGTLIFAIKIIARFVSPGNIIESIIHYSRFHLMMLGALGAILYKKRNVLFLRLVDNKLTQIVCWIILFLAAINKFNIAWIVDHEIIAMIGLCVIIGQVNRKNRILNLENNILDFLGKISYGIYVVHPLIIFLCGKFFTKLIINRPLKYILAYIAVSAIVILVSHLSYKYMESYFIKQKKKYEVIPSAPSPGALS